MGFMQLRTGVLIIGYFKLVIYALLLLYGYWLCTRFDPLNVASEDYQKVKDTVSWLGKIITAIAAIHLLFIGFLVSGTHTGSTCHLKAYIIFTSINLSLVVLGFLTNPAAYFVILPGIVFEVGCLIFVVRHKSEIKSSLSQVTV